MDLSNLGIVYRAQGRLQEAADLFGRAHQVMENALGPEDPKTQMILRNYATTQIINVNDPPKEQQPPKHLQSRLAAQKTTKSLSLQDIDARIQAATEKREALLSARREKAATPRLSPRSPRNPPLPKAPQMPHDDNTPVIPPVQMPPPLMVPDEVEEEAPSGAALLHQQVIEIDFKSSSPETPR